MSTLKTDELSNLAGDKVVPMGTVVDGSAKAWVNFDGTETVAIRTAFNVSSITDNGAGDYRANFTNNMTHAGYSISLTLQANSLASCTVKGIAGGAKSQDVTGFPIYCYSTSAFDCVSVSATVLSK